MEFHAYPSEPQGTTLGSLRVLWRAQGLLHGSDSVVVPAVLISSIVSMAVYEHVTAGSIRNYWILILVSMVPLALLERKLFACPEPLRMLSKFSTKVMLMYAAFTAYRVLFPLFVERDIGVLASWPCAALAAACVLLPTVFGFRVTPACLWEHRDVWCLQAVALLAAVSTELTMLFTGGYTAKLFRTSAWYRKKYLKLCFTAASDYTEVLAFLPAIWMVCRPGKAVESDAGVSRTQQRAAALLAFLVSFYAFEDLLTAHRLLQEYPRAAAGVMAHFLLVLDFAAFVLAHLYDPEKHEKLMGSFRRLVYGSSMV